MWEMHRGKPAALVASLLMLSSLTAGQEAAAASKPDGDVAVRKEDSKLPTESPDNHNNEGGSPVREAPGASGIQDAKDEGHLVAGNLGSSSNQNLKEEEDLPASGTAEEQEKQFSKTNAEEEKDEFGVSSTLGESSGQNMKSKETPQVAEALEGQKEGLSKMNVEEEKEEDREGVTDGYEPLEKNRFLFNNFRTMTHTRVSISSSKVYYTCSSTATTDTCSRRRKRRRVGVVVGAGGEGKSLLSGSLGSELDIDEASEDKPAEKNSRLFGVTPWTLKYETTTVTSFFTDTSTTVSLSYRCTLGLISQYPACG